MERPFLLMLALTAACGGRERPSEMRPTSDQVRAFYGLEANNCWMYRYTEMGQPQLLTISVSEPNDRVIAGALVYVVKFSRPSGGLPDEWYLDAETDAEIRLRRSITGRSQAERVTSRYDDVAPLFGRFKLVAGETTLEVGERFEVETTPTDEMGAAKTLELHRWEVQADNEMVETPSGSQTAFTLQYLKDGTPATYSLVPGFGFAKYTDFTGTFYQVCDAGTGADACAALSCN